MASCSECDKAIHVFHVKKEAGEKLKLLQQSQCGVCWRPLQLNRAWPGPRESLRPPFQTAAESTDSRICVAQCGHLFHSLCLSYSTSVSVSLTRTEDFKMSHCPICFVWIERSVFRQVLVKNAILIFLFSLLKKVAAVPLSFRIDF